MDRLVYTALSGLKSHLASQAAIANNIANASTIGYRADRVNFERLVMKGGNNELDSRAPAAEEVVDMDRRAGAITSTGRKLDIAVQSDSWIAVQAADGSEAYTRRGDLQVTLAGTLETGDHFPVMGAGGPITVPPYQSIEIAEDGRVLIVPQGAERGAPPQEIGQVKLVSATGSKTVKGLDNLLHVEGGGALPADMLAKVRSGALEQSNVNLTQALVDMIENQRSYEVQANLLKEAKSMDESAANLMRVQA
ncbi:MULTISPECIES: flagellar basal body rod protein FlgF [unclassified Sphingomonas]|uniref:flagellar basal body rod protein FlgF n=1 Tax=unclassified Sphingomonas TaxID=196159 RepID=UPI0006FF2009|nr:MULTISPECIES: flagellar basal body rod protein FlgF [unclassified Sphingomonas]KQM96786.1 flagellar biosynthesis protein FlgF [Sphingomonas sp. Leaf25]KQN39564.1 flagellar biosynthesis protein FlgF [Sphingomonas sp. Leaf42]KQT28841.1 flagellar biosynthesis protein FlgF [Sphingomonas sp. Leaf407]